MKVSNEQKVLLNKLDKWIRDMTQSYYNDLCSEYRNMTGKYAMLHTDLSRVKRTEEYNSFDKIGLNFLREKYKECNGL